MDLQSMWFRHFGWFFWDFLNDDFVIKSQGVIMFQGGILMFLKKSNEFMTSFSNIYGYFLRTFLAVFLFHFINVRKMWMCFLSKNIQNILYIRIPESSIVLGRPLNSSGTIYFIRKRQLYLARSTNLEPSIQFLPETGNCQIHPGAINFIRKRHFNPENP